MIPDHDELRTSAEKSTSTHFDDSTYPLTALRAATELGSTFSAPATLTNGSTRSPRTAHRPDAWDRPGQRRVPSRCAHAVLKPADETGRGHVGQPGLHSGPRLPVLGCRPGGCASTRVPYQQNTSPLHGVAMIPARGHIIATCGPYSPKVAPSPLLSSHPPLQSVRREIQKPP